MLGKIKSTRCCCIIILLCALVEFAVELGDIGGDTIIMEGHLFWAYIISALFFWADEHWDDVCRHENLVRYDWGRRIINSPLIIIGSYTDPVSNSEVSASVIICDGRHRCVVGFIFIGGPRRPSLSTIRSDIIIKWCNGVCRLFGAGVIKWNNNEIYMLYSKHVKP